MSGDALEKFLRNRARLKESAPPQTLLNPILHTFHHLAQPTSDDTETSDKGVLQHLVENVIGLRAELHHLPKAVGIGLVAAVFLGTFGGGSSSAPAMSTSAIALEAAGIEPWTYAMLASGPDYEAKARAIRSVVSDPDQPQLRLVSLGPDTNRAAEQRVRVMAPPPPLLVRSTAPLPIPPAIPRRSADSHGEALAGGSIEQVVEVHRGDTLLGLLVDAGIDHTQANAAIDALADVFAPRDLMPGQEITIRVNPDDEAEVDQQSMQLVGLNLQPDPSRDLQVRRNPEGGFDAKAVRAPVSLRVKRVESTISSSLFESGTAMNVPAAVMTEMIRALSYDVDFQRDIHRGDTFEVVYQQLENSQGASTRSGDILFASVVLSGHEYALYRFTPQGGTVGFYHPDGQSIRKALLRTPIDGARISSGFGMRRHPILGYSAFHKGVDFAAPTGTPIFAAGDGTVVQAGRNGSYGNYVRIRHTDSYATAYAHVSRFAPGLKVGSRIHQGDIVAFVGTTGRSTGPHLHYEVLVDGRQINPQSVTLPVGNRLAGKDLKQFAAARAAIDRLRNGLDHPALVASAHFE